MTDLNINIFEARRAKVASNMEKNSILLLSSSHIVSRNNDTTFPFRQDSNFYYLTGFEEPDSVLMLKSDGSSTIFCRQKNPDLEKWDGFMWGFDEAKKQFKFSEGHNISDIDKLLPTMIRGTSVLYSLVGKDKDFDAKVINWVNAANGMERHQTNIDLKNFSNILGLMRLIKEPEEISLIRKSCEIAAISHKKVMSKAKVGMTESDLETMYLNEFKLNGSREPSYTPIVAGGARACILHYVDNNQPINDGDLVLVDAGCEFGLYASDITRTYPINGKFTSAQLAIYEVVLEAQQKSIEAVTVNNNVMDSQIISEKVITQGLIDLGILNGSMEELHETGAFKDFYMHKIGHWLGIDVHDAGDYTEDGEYMKFKPGMVTTVEPGIYISSTANVKDQWKGIGIRIEDNILVTAKGNQNLTDFVPSNPKEIEALMA